MSDTFDWYAEALAAADDTDDLGARCGGDRGVSRAEVERDENGPCPACYPPIPAHLRATDDPWGDIPTPTPRPAGVCFDDPPF